MIKVRLATASNRRQVVVDGDTSPFELLQQEEVTIEGASINLDGIPLTREEFHAPLSTLTQSDSTTLSVVIKTENA